VSVPPSSGAVVNGGFETGSLSPWTCSAAGGATVQSSTVHSGSHALTATPTASDTAQCQQTLTLKANTAYTLTGWIQGSYVYLGVSGGATASTWASPGSTWQKLTVTFTTGSSTSVTLYIHGWYGQSAYSADDIGVA